MACGLFAFDNGAEADAAIAEIEANYTKHQQAAREIAEHDDRIKSTVNDSQGTCLSKG
jgi:hypothetical protein